MKCRPTLNLKCNKQILTHFLSWHRKFIRQFAEEDYDFDMSDGPGTSSRLVLELIHPRVVSCLSSSPPIIMMPSKHELLFLRNFINQKKNHVKSSFPIHVINKEEKMLHKLQVLLFKYWCSEWGWKDAGFCGEIFINLKIKIWKDSNKIP